MINGRPSRDEVLMANALEWSRRSTCSRAQVGCVISREGRTLTTGYNGAPAAMAHCDHSCDCEDRVKGCIAHGGPDCVCHDWSDETTRHLRGCRSEMPCTNVIHSEANAIAFAARWGVGTMGAEIHTTRVPCMTCAGLIINAGIVRVVWLQEHREMTGWERLAQAGLEVVRWG